MKPIRSMVALAVCLPSLAVAQAIDTSVHVTVGGFVDAYYAFDFNRPPLLDRPFTTQAARHNETNINLAFLQAVLAAPRVRGRFAAQFGTSVQANYAGEPRVGTLSGPEVSRFIQEATAGYQLAPSLWVDGGVFLAPFGSENWISRDNWTYTRSLIADESPFYEAGAKLTWQARPNLTLQAHLINGWQNISETNSDKAFGGRIDWTPVVGVALAYDLFLGNEAPDNTPAQLRQFHEVIAQVDVTPAFSLRGTVDYGLQARVAGGHAAWYGWVGVAHYRATSTVAFAGRVEAYADSEQVIVVTGQAAGLRASGFSFNADISLPAGLLWRSEIRTLGAHDPIFSQRSGVIVSPSERDTVVLTSLALTF